MIFKEFTEKKMKMPDQKIGIKQITFFRLPRTMKDKKISIFAKFFLKLIVQWQKNLMHTVIY